MASALSAPLHEMRAMIGTGADGLGPALDAVRTGLATISRDVSAASTGVRWTGAAADAARDVTLATVAAIDALGERAERLGAAATAASDAVVRARARIDAIIEEFEARALATDPDDPGEMAELVEHARRAQDEARSVLSDLTGELDARAATVESTGSTTPAAGGPTGSSPWSGLGSGVAAAAPLTSAAASGLRSSAGSAVPAAHTAGGRGSPSGTRRPTPSPDSFGSDTTVTLPDGATASAPNAVAASAVRHALTQLGVPYDWGGTTPGVGLDCSGLTQWAYGQAGLDLPRLAQEQDIGAAVSRDDLRPGDLAVWDGHVAMVAGDGLMVEAGDPVKLSPIRTTNAGQGFQGFWRPTA
ncbi:C40 family peptidase [Mycolicibacterium sediminis]